jgi:hypothetical protein
VRGQVVCVDVLELRLAAGGAGEGGVLDGGVARLRHLSRDHKLTNVALPFEGYIGMVYGDMDHGGVWVLSQNVPPGVSVYW